MAPITEILAPDSAGIARGAALLAAGGLVAFPTETVYGLGADARSDSAVAGIYAAKGRPSVNPLIVHLAAPDQAAALAQVTPLAERLAGAFWPGPLTLVLPLRDGHGLSERVTAGLGTVGLRVPDAPVAQALLTTFGGPVAAPSANPSGRISPTTAAHVLEGLAGRIDAVIDGGACTVGLESTIVDLSGETPRLLRAGAVSVEEMSAAASLPVTGDGKATEDDAPSAPGQMSRHYAPRTPLRLNATDVLPGELLLGFGPVQGSAENLSPAGDLREAAANLFAALHRLDEQGARAIAIAPIPDTGIGRALNDRLRRAATPRL
ncbi:MAG: L-threonylcarbamoyladenylate synthase [Rhodobacteraceae bacterium]|nr:L-threonylcarbamoyladenylate synthase [Paracoccaceae bacterium]